jgi:hypothetical protein
MEVALRQTLVASPPKDRAQFAFLVREFVSRFYPGTEPSYGLRLFDQHLAGFKNDATARRRVWAIRDGRDSVGFLVATRRLDNSVKLGPIVVEPGRRAEGHALTALEQIAILYGAERLSYLYATRPSANISIGRIADRAGWDIAGVVRGLYRDDEEVLIHRTLSDKPVFAYVPVLPRRSPQTRLVRKRGGSVLLRVDESDSPHEIELAGRSAALALRSSNRICFSRVTRSVASLLNADEAIQLVDGTILTVWR